MRIPTSIILIWIVFKMTVSGAHAAKSNDVARLSVTISAPATNNIGTPFAVAICITNVSSEALAVRKIGSSWQWIIMCDSKGSNVQTKMPYYSIAPDTEDSFVLLKPSEGVKGEKLCKWVLDPKQRQAISPGLSPETKILDCDDSRYAFVKQGKHSLYFLMRSPNDTRLKKNGKWLSIKDVLGGDPFIGEARSNTVEIKFVQ